MRESHRPRPRSVSDDDPPSQPATSHTPVSADEAAHEQPAPAWSGCLLGFAQRVFLLLGFYVLSMGPMYWHWYGGRFAGGSQLVAAFYEPIFVMATLLPWFGEWMDWYVGLWIA